MKVILLNPDLTYAAPPQMLQGLSGKTYAMSRWNAVYLCHTVEMSPEEFEKCWLDIQRAVHLQMRRWFPRFIVPERPAAVQEFESAYELGIGGGELAETASFSARVGWKVGRGLRGSMAEVNERDDSPERGSSLRTTRRRAAPRGRAPARQVGDAGAAVMSVIAPE